jgi:hypothetical protein
MIIAVGFYGVDCSGFWQGQPTFYIHPPSEKIVWPEAVFTFILAMPHCCCVFW